jgi:hypothetical protein
VSILANLSVCLFGDVGGRDEDAELAMADPRDKATDIADTDPVVQAIALRL